MLLYQIVTSVYTPNKLCTSFTFYSFFGLVQKRICGMQRNSILLRSIVLF